MLQFNALAEDLLHIGPTLLLADLAEEHIHFLQGATFGLLDEEENEHHHGETEHPEHDKSAPANVIHSSRRNLGDDEVEEPLGARS